MRVLAHVLGYPPALNAGAQMMVHTMLRYLVQHGHQCQVLDPMSRPCVFQGIPISKLGTRRVNVKMWEWADIIITHLDLTPAAIQLREHTGKPLVHVVHNDQQLNFFKVTRENADLVIWNSEWIRRAYAPDWADANAMVLRPPVFGTEYRVASEGGRDRITLINMSEAKGAATFWALADMLPQRRFLGVLGSYGPQIYRKRDSLPPNVMMLPNVPADRMAAKVYSQTRILLMPSSYESWGRTAIEAAASGIPTIAHPTAGLKEALGNSGVLCDRADIREWAREIEDLDAPERYAERSAAARTRSQELDTAACEDLAAFEQALRKLVPNAD
jgi:glycosyltransferase involved in cell wall biosynthesis